MSKLTDLLEEHASEAVYKAMMDLRNRLEAHIKSDETAREDYKCGMYYALGFVDDFAERHNPHPYEEDE